MGGCESQQNIHIDENNMVGDAPAPTADLGSPLFGPEAGTGEEVDANDNGITVMATMVEDAVNNQTANSAVLPNGAMEYTDDKTGEKFVYYDSLEEAQRAADAANAAAGINGHYAQHSEMHYSGDQTYAAEQATVSVPVTTHHQEEATVSVPVAAHHQEDQTAHRGSYQAPQPVYHAAEAAEHGGYYQVNQHHRYGHQEEETAHQGYGGYQAPQPQYGSHHEEIVDYQAPQPQYGSHQEDVGYGAHTQPQYGSRRPVYEEGPAAYDSQPQYDENAEHHHHEAAEEQLQAADEDAAVNEEQAGANEKIDAEEVSDEEAEEKTKKKDKKKKKRSLWRSWM